MAAKAARDFSDPNARSSTRTSAAVNKAHPAPAARPATMAVTVPPVPMVTEAAPAKMATPVTVWTPTHPSATAVDSLVLRVNPAHPAVPVPEVVLVPTAERALLALLAHKAPRDLLVATDGMGTRVPVVRTELSKTDPVATPVPLVLLVPKDPEALVALLAAMATLVKMDRRAKAVTLEAQAVTEPPVWTERLVDPVPMVSSALATTALLLVWLQAIKHHAPS